ncbi:MAG: hypothetical protein M0Z28_09645 [Rhodospirillales bacterium]|nr:hypothetical protein [Rhodospirillales bacterium]
MQDNPEADRANWTIKAVDVPTRKTAVDCAGRAGLSVAQWLERAVRTQANVDEGNAVIPPDERPTAPANHPMPKMDDILHAISVLAAAGVPVPKALGRQVYAAIGAEVRRRRGLAPLSRPGQPKRLRGPTIEADG